MNIETLQNAFNALMVVFGLFTAGTTLVSIVAVMDYFRQHKQTLQMLYKSLPISDDLKLRIHSTADDLADVTKLISEVTEPITDTTNPTGKAG